MRTLDLTPVFRSTVGFDRMARLLDHAMRATEAANVPTFPPYNIEKLNEDDYRITMAVAGFGEGDLDITVENGQLVISGKIEKPEEDARNYLHRGIAARQFQRSFVLADGVDVGEAVMENGLLHVDLTRSVPDRVVQTIKIRKG